MWKPWMHRTIKEMNWLTLPRGLGVRSRAGRGAANVAGGWRVLGLGIQIRSERVGHSAFYVSFFSAYLALAPLDLRDDIREQEYHHQLRSDRG
jgi:hypothetical protein